MPRPRSAEEKIRAQRERAQNLIAIKESSSYPVLKEIVEAKIRREMRTFISTPAVSQQELDYGRGLLAGMQAVLDVVEKGEQQLELAIKQAHLLEEIEEVN